MRNRRRKGRMVLMRTVLGLRTSVFVFSATICPVQAYSLTDGVPVPEDLAQESVG